MSRVFISDRPGMLALLGQAYWDAWNSKKGISQEAAKTEYIARAVDLVIKYGTK